MNPLQFPQRIANTLLFRLVMALAYVPLVGIAADDPVAAPVAPRVKAQMQIQGGAQLQIQGGRQFQLQIGGVQVQAAAGNVAPAAVAKPQPGQLPVIFFPGIPSILLPNPAAQGDAKPGYLGLHLDTTPADEGDGADPKEKDQGKKNAGVGILEVVEDSPAAEAGVKEGDRVLAVDGKAVKDSTELRETIRAAKANRTVKLSVRRDGKEIELKAKLGEAPDAQAMIQFAAQNGPAAVPGVVVFNRSVTTRSSTGSLAGSPKGAPSDKDTVSLRDGNRFSGRILGIDPARGLVLQREGLPELDLLEEGISSLTFAERGNSAAAPSKVHVQLRDGSWFNGDALTMEGGKVLLALPGGQSVEVPKEQVQFATVSESQAPRIYEGPTGIAGWTFGRGNQGYWDYKDGFIRCLTNGPIGRNCERMPDPVDLSFDVVYPAQLQHFGVSLFATGVTQSGPGALMLQFSPSQISGNHFDGRRSNQYIANLQPRADRFDAKPATSRYRLLVDRVNGLALIYINGVKRAEWKLSKVQPQDIGKCGAYLNFSPNVFTPDHSFQIGRMRLLPWDGKEPADGAEPATSKTDQVLADDGAAENGTIERITAGEILLANPGRTVRRDKTLHVRFAAPPTPQQLPAAAALLRLKNGSEFAATQIRGDGSAMTLTTRFGSPITLPFSTLRDLEFLTKPGQPEQSPKDLDVLTLTDGTQWKGKVLTPISGGILRWKIAASKAPIEFPSARVAGVFFSPAKGKADTAALKGSGAVRLRTGDWLPGDVVSLDASRLVFKTDLTPELAVPLASVHSLYLGSGVTASLADAATGPDLWTGGWNPNRGNPTRQQFAAMSKSDQPWMYHDGSYTLTGASRSGGAVLARKWPAYAGSYALNFDIANSGPSASFNIQLFNSKEEPSFTIYSFGGRVNVYFNPGSSARNNRLGGAVKRFQVEGRAEPARGNLRVAVVLDRSARTFRLLMSGKEIGKIAFKPDEVEDALNVGAAAITPMSTTGLANGRQYRIAGLWLAPWEGSTAGSPGAAEKEDAGAPDAEPKKDAGPVPTIVLANGDEFAGTIEGFSADVLTVNSDAGPLELPGKRVAWIHFPGSDATAPDHFPRLRFHDRGLLSVKDLRLENERVRCQTLQGQALEFPLNLVKEVVFRPADER